MFAFSCGHPIDFADIDVNIGTDTIIDIDNGMTAMDYIESDYETLIKDADDSFRKHLDFMMKCVKTELWRLNIYDEYAEQEQVVAAKAKVEVKVAVVERSNICNVYVDISNLSAELGVINPSEFHSLYVKNMRQGYVVGSFPSASDPYWGRWRALGYNVKVFGPGKEQGVDETLHSIMLRNIILDNVDIVLATGDGNCAGWTNFPECCKVAMEKGINVKVVSWKQRLNKAYNNVYAGKITGKLSIEFMDRNKQHLLKPIQ